MDTENLDLSLVKNNHLLKETEQKSISMMSKRFVDITGKTFNKLTAVRLIGIRKKQTIWLYKCECGEYVISPYAAVVSGHVSSCGCSLKEVLSAKREKNAEDSIGTQYGELTIIGPAPSLDGRAYVHARCSCGNENDYRLKDLKTGNTKSCGCLKRNSNLLRHRKEAETNVGKIFGKLKVLSVVETTNGPAKVLCRCECGNEGIYRINALKANNVRSCGCLKKEKNRERGLLNVEQSIGEVFGNLTVLSFSEFNNVSRVNCQCSCGNIKEVRLSDLRQGKIQSCGCIKPKYKNENIRNIAGSLTRLVSRSFQRNSMKKNLHTVEIIGIDREGFIKHLESLFEPWMNLSNYGHSTQPGTWSIDHIIPSSYAETLSDLLYINHYTNLRPFCSIENIKKSGYVPDDFDSEAFRKFKDSVDADRMKMGLCSIMELVYRIEKSYSPNSAGGWDDIFNDEEN